ncbi:hypothetical protein TNCV_346981 [Trichonephila clavipes]|nr:hypothetical protein TNCV_346981 [Trichonephila clavipes]
MSSRWCGVVVRRGGASSGVVHVTLPWFKITLSVAKSPRVAEQCDINIHSPLPPFILMLWPRGIAGLCMRLIRNKVTKSHHNCKLEAGAASIESNVHITDPLKICRFEDMAQNSHVGVVWKPEVLGAS